MDKKQIVEKWLQDLELTIAPCSNSCWHCYTNAHSGKDKAIDINDLEKIFDKFQNWIKEYGIDTVKTPPLIYINQELLLHPNWLQIYKTAQRYGFSLTEKENLTTNGRVIAKNIDNPAFGAQLNQFSPSAIQLALHGNQQRHDELVCKKGAFNDITKSANFAISNKIPLQWIYFFNKDNIADFPQIYTKICEIMETDKPAVYTAIPSHTGRMLLTNEHLRPTADDFKVLSDSDIALLNRLSDNQDFFGDYFTQQSFLENYQQNPDKFGRWLNNFAFAQPVIHTDFSVYFTLWKTGMIANFASDDCLEKVQEAFAEADRFAEFLTKIDIGSLLIKYADLQDRRLYWPNSLSLKLILKIAAGEKWFDKFRFDYFLN